MDTSQASSCSLSSFWKSAFSSSHFRYVPSFNIENAALACSGRSTDVSGSLASVTPTWVFTSSSINDCVRGVIEHDCCGHLDTWSPDPSNAQSASVQERSKAPVNAPASRRPHCLPRALLRFGTAAMPSTNPHPRSTRRLTMPEDAVVRLPVDLQWSLSNPQTPVVTIAFGTGIFIAPTMAFHSCTGCSWSPKTAACPKPATWSTARCHHKRIHVKQLPLNSVWSVQLPFQSAQRLLLRHWRGVVLTLRDNEIACFCLIEQHVRSESLWHRLQAAFGRNCTRSCSRFVSPGGLSYSLYGPSSPS